MATQERLQEALQQLQARSEGGINSGGTCAQARSEGVIDSGGGTCAQSKREGARFRGAVLSSFATTQTNEQLKDN